MTVFCYNICCAAHMSSKVLIKVHLVYLYINVSNPLSIKSNLNLDLL